MVALRLSVSFKSQIKTAFPCHMEHSAQQPVWQQTTAVRHPASRFHPREDLLDFVKKKSDAAREAWVG